MEQNRIPVNKLLTGGLFVTLLSACGDNGGQAGKPVLPQSQSPAALLYVEKCSACHTVPLPSKHTARLWPSVLQRMQIRMKSKGVKKLSRDELAILLDYLQKHAKSENND